MSTFLEGQDLVLDWLDDPNAGYFTRAKVKQWLNFGQREVQKLLLKAGENWYLTCSQTTCVANQSDYAFPSNFLKSHRVVIVNSPGTTGESESELYPITLNEQNFLSSQASFPEGFFLKKTRLIILPKPDTTYTLRLYYSYRIPDMVNDAEVPDVPEQYHELVWILGAENGFLKDGRDASLLREKKKEYKELLGQDAEDRVEDKPREVVTTDSY